MVYLLLAVNIGVGLLAFTANFERPLKVALTILFILGNLLMLSYAVGP